MKNIPTIIMAIGLIIVAILAFNTSKEMNITNYGTESNFLTVTGNAEFEVQPDEAKIYLGYETTKDTAKEAQDELKSIMNNILDDISEETETYQYDVSKVEKWNKETEQYDIIGYKAKHIVKITTTRLDIVGNIIDTAINNKANIINDITFTLSDAKKLKVKQQALKLAGDNAKEKAKTLASSMGVSIDKPYSISEGSVYIPRIYTASKDIMMGVESSANSYIPSNKVTVTASINVKYKI